MRTLKAFLLILTTSLAVAQESVQPATQAEVNAGVRRDRYVSPATLSGWTGGSGSGSFVAKTGDTMTGPLTNNFGYYGDGGGLTNLQADAISGTIPSEHIPIGNPGMRRVDVREFGAKVDVVGFQATITNGSFSLHTTNTGTFSAGDVGKVVSVWLAGEGRRNLTATITNVVNDTNVLIDVAAATGATNFMAIFGTDDTAAFQSALDYFTNTTGLEIYIPAGMLINGEVQDQGDRATHENYVVKVPPMPPGGVIMPTLIIRGYPGRGQVTTKDSIVRVPGSSIWFTQPKNPNPQHDSALFSVKNQTSPVFVGGGSIHAPERTWFNSCHVRLEDISFFTSWNNDFRVVDLRSAMNCGIKGIEISSVVYFSRQPTNNVDLGVAFEGTNGIALCLPSFFSDPQNVVTDFKISGYYLGMDAAENVVASAGRIWGCLGALTCLNGTAGESVFIGMDVQRNKYALYAPLGHRWNVSVYNMLLSHAMPGQPASHDIWGTNDVYVVYDPHSTIIGEVSFSAQEALGSVKYKAVYNSDRLRLRQKSYNSVGYTELSPMRIQSGEKYGSLKIGADFDTNTITANVTKAFSIVMPSYSAGNSLMDVGASFADRFAPFGAVSASGNNQVYIGTDQFQNQVPAAQNIFFFTAATQGDLGTLRWTITPSGFLHGLGGIAAGGLTTFTNNNNEYQLNVGRHTSGRAGVSLVSQNNPNSRWIIQKEVQNATGLYSDAMILRYSGPSGTADKFWLGTNGLLNVPAGFHSGSDINHPGAAKLPYGATASHIVLTNGAEGTDVLLTNSAAGTLQVRTNLNVLGTATAVDVTATTVTADEVYAGNLLTAEEALADGHFLTVQNGTNIVGTLDGGALTNLYHTEAVLATTGNATNYTVSLLGRDEQTIFTANTNANITFSGITLGRSVQLWVDAMTSSVPCIVTFPANVVTNSQMVLTVTNGTARIYDLRPKYGTDSTNVWITAGDVYQR